jgi:hypothetical protein
MATKHEPADRKFGEHEVGDREVLVIRGRLDRAGRFTVGRCRSTPHVREWPVIDRKDVIVELLDREMNVLHREPAGVYADLTCSPGDAQSFRVEGYIELRPDATAVRLRRNDLVLWYRDIPEAPQAELSVSRGKRGRTMLVRLATSDGGEGANMLVMYQWGARRFQPVYTGEPTTRLDIDLSEMPGGEECRLLVTYSNGLRSVSLASETFAMPLVGPSVTIVQPIPDTAVVAATPVVLEGGVIDRERLGGPNLDSDLIWLVDGEQVGNGPITSIDGLAEGEHTIELVYADPSRDQRFVAATQVVSRRSKYATADDWDDWDPFDQP